MRKPLSTLFCLWLFGCSAVEQSAVCAQYVRCVGARDAAAGTQTDVVRFEPGGGCWGNGESAELCDRACENGLVYLGAFTDTPAECAP